MAVHGRYRKPCPRCGAPVQRIVYAENETNYCAPCQTGGKVLADRSLSRLLRDDWPRTLEAWEESPMAGGGAPPLIPCGQGTALRHQAGGGGSRSSGPGGWLRWPEVVLPEGLHPLGLRACPPGPPPPAHRPPTAPGDAPHEAARSTHSGPGIRWSPSMFSSRVAWSMSDRITSTVRYRDSSGPRPPRSAGWRGCRFPGAPPDRRCR